MITELAKKKKQPRVHLASDVNNSTSENGVNWDAVLEYTLVTFLIVLITNLLMIGRIPTLEECYVPLLGALLAGLYAYGRIRQLDIQEPSD